MSKQKAALIGEHSISKKLFPHLDTVFKQFGTKEFQGFIESQRSEKVNRTLFELIQKEPEPCFLLSAVLEFVERVDREQILSHYSFTSFELWLNQFSGLSPEDNYRVRAKIAGKWVERSEYQVLFPIGMGKVYEGTHFVTAHKSPDLDTTVASFWGWMDAFAARVGDGLHIWNLPGGPPPSQIEIEWLFTGLFGGAVFSHLAKTRTALSLTANDLMTQKGLMRKVPSESIGGSEHERDHNAIVIVDEEGFYLGDWRSFDVEGVRQVIILLSSCLRWFENNLHLDLITLFAKEELYFDDISPLLKNLFEMKVGSCEPASEFTSKQEQLVDGFLTRVLGLKKGLSCTFDELGAHLGKMSGVPFEGLEAVLGAMRRDKLFDAKGKLIEGRPRIFSFMEKAVRVLHEAIFKIRVRLEKLDVALKTKYEVFGHHPTYVTARSDVEEIRNKMGSYPYLTIVHPDEGRLFPVGVVQAGDLRKSILGTVSLRDFCNRDEMTIPAYLEVISVIDHHKSVLNTFSPPMAIIADVQSSNSLVALRAFQINDRYSLLGQTPKQIDAQMEDNIKMGSSESMHLLERLLKRRLIAEKNSPFYIHVEREYIEYLHFLYGILDDTDLLSKVSAIDVDCVASLLNRLKSISLGKEVVVVSLDDLPRDKNFPKKAAERILRNEDMYSLYRKVYAYRENEVEANISLSSKGKPSNLFADTKEQNGCCRVGQTKIFANNVPLFESHANSIRKTWLETAQLIHKEKPEIDLHIHMISTIVSAEEVYKGNSGKYPHKDELWIWVPKLETAIEHLKRFLSAFQSSPGIKGNSFEVEFLGADADDLALIFQESFIEIPQKRSNKNLPIAVLRYNAGSLNSRKAMISPFLPILSN